MSSISSRSFEESSENIFYDGPSFKNKVKCHSTRFSYVSKIENRRDMFYYTMSTLVTWKYITYYFAPLSQTLNKYPCNTCFVWSAREIHFPIRIKKCTYGSQKRYAKYTDKKRIRIFNKKAFYLFPHLTVWCIFVLIFSLFLFYHQRWVSFLSVEWNLLFSG